MSYDWFKCFTNEHRSPLGAELIGEMGPEGWGYYKIFMNICWERFYNSQEEKKTDSDFVVLFSFKQLQRELFISPRKLLQLIDICQKMGALSYSFTDHNWAEIQKNPDLLPQILRNFDASFDQVLTKSGPDLVQSWSTFEKKRKKFLCFQFYNLLKSLNRDSKLTRQRRVTGALDKTRLEKTIVNRAPKAPARQEQQQLADVVDIHSNSSCQDFELYYDVENLEWIKKQLEESVFRRQLKYDEKQLPYQLLKLFGTPNNFADWADGVMNAKNCPDAIQDPKGFLAYFSRALFNKKENKI